MIQDAQGLGEELQDNIIANIGDKNIPDTAVKKLDGRYGNTPCSILSIENKFDIFHRFLFVGLDYGTYLDIRWLYAVDRPDRSFKGGGSLIVGYLDRKEKER